MLHVYEIAEDNGALHYVATVQFPEDVEVIAHDTEHYRVMGALNGEHFDKLLHANDKGDIAWHSLDGLDDEKQKIKKVMDMLKTK